MKTKHTVFAFCLLGIFLFSAFQIQAQGTKKIKPTKELILGIPSLTEKTLPDLISVLKETAGADYVKYCDLHKVVLIQYDPEVFPNPENLVKALSDQNFSLKVFVKEGSFEEIQDLCN